MWESIRNAFGSLVNWIVSVIKACWQTFLVFIWGVITMAGAIIKAIRWMIDKIIGKIDNWRNKIKQKVIRFFVIKTPKNNDAFKKQIQQAEKEGKIGSTTLNLNESSSTNATTAYEDVNIVQTDGDLNTEHVYTVKGDKFGEDFRRQCGEDVTEINLNL